MAAVTPGPLWTCPAAGAKSSPESFWLVDAGLALRLDRLIMFWQTPSASSARPAGADPLCARHGPSMTPSHHGSRTSSSDAFLRAVGPSAVVFSVQRDNRLGHPAPIVLARYEALGAQIFRTDHDGAIPFWTDGHALGVERYGDRPVSVAVAGSVPPAAPVTPAPAAGPPS